MTDPRPSQQPAGSYTLLGSALLAGLGGIGGKFHRQRLVQQVRDGEAEQRLRVLCAVGIDPIFKGGRIADQAVADATARWEAHVAFMQTTPWPVRRRKADFFDDVAREISAGNWGPG